MKISKIINKILAFKHFKCWQLCLTLYVWVCVLSVFVFFFLLLLLNKIVDKVIKIKFEIIKHKRHNNYTHYKGKLVWWWKADGMIYKCWDGALRHTLRVDTLLLLLSLNHFVFYVVKILCFIFISIFFSTI